MNQDIDLATADVVVEVDDAGLGRNNGDEANRHGDLRAPGDPDQLYRLIPIRGSD